MKMLITGGAGFIGSHLCDRYIQQGHTVICLDNFTSGDITNIQHLIKNRKFRLINGDIRNSAFIENVVRDVDTIIHLAAQIRVDRSMADPRLTYDVNVGGTLNMLEAARMYDVERFLFASSSEIYGSAQYTPIDENHPFTSGNPYGASKIAGDRLCHSYAVTYGMNIGILRPFNIYGVRQKDSAAGVIPIFINRVLADKPPVIHGDGSQSRDYVYVDDIISAYDYMLRSISSPGAVNFGTGHATTVKVLAETIIRLCGKKIKPEYHNTSMNTTVNLVAGIEKAKALGWTPQYSLEEGLTKFIKWYRGAR